MRGASRKRLQRTVRSHYLKGKFRITVQLHGPTPTVKKKFDTPEQRENYIKEVKAKPSYISHTCW